MLKRMPNASCAALTCHPCTPAGAVRRVAVEVRRSADGMLALGFGVDGEIDRIRIPTPGPLCMEHQLWLHTCFEAFLAFGEGGAYHELNLAPSRAWMAYSFESYREGLVTAGDMTPVTKIDTGVAGGRFALDAVVALDRLSRVHRSAALRVGLAAVIETTDGSLSYWALRHPPGRPDFHHADTWTMRLEAPA